VTTSDRPPTRVSEGDIRPRNVKTIVFGATFIVWGLLLAFYQLDIRFAFAFWPILLVGWGVGKVLGAASPAERHSGVWLLAVGLWFALNELTIFDYHDTWPLLVVAVGILIIWDEVGGRRPAKPSEDSRG
jgi:hypothetical protein